MIPEPFPHLVLDDWWEPHLLEACVDEFDRMTEASWFKANVIAEDLKGVQAPVEIKQSVSFDRCGQLPAALAMRQVLSSPDFISFLEQATGIQRLRFDTLGGGLHRIVPGGLLAQHVDFNVADGKWRRVNVLIYLSECNGGELQLSNVDCTLIKSVVPKFNRMVVFNCSETSWHGHPEPLGPGPDRRSLAAYYFTEEPPLDAAPPHQTLFRFLRQEP